MCMFAVPFPGTSQSAPCKQGTFRDVFVASLCLMHPPRKPFCCKMGLSGINYPRGTRPGQAPATPKLFLSRFHLLPAAPRRVSAVGRVTLLLPGSLGPLGEVKQQGERAGRREQVSYPMDTYSRRTKIPILSQPSSELKGSTQRAFLSRISAKR